MDDLSREISQLARLLGVVRELRELSLGPRTVKKLPYVKVRQELGGENLPLLQ